MQKGFLTLFVLLGVLIVSGLVASAFYLGRQTTLQPSPQSVISSSPQPTPQPSITPLATPATSSPILNKTPKSLQSDYTETETWQIYTDTKAGFSIKYPPGFKISEKIEGQKVNFLSCSGDLCLSGMTMTVYNDYDGGFRREWLNKKFDLSTYDPYYEDLNVTGVNALVAATRDSGSNNTVFVVIPKRSKIYLYSAPGGAIPSTERPNLNWHKKVVSTFKFQ